MSHNAILTSPDRKQFLLTRWSAVDALPPGYYDYDCGPFGVQFDIKGVSAERIQRASAEQNKLFLAVNDFWNKKHLYQKMQVRHRLAIMLYGIPGTGKTVTMRQAIDDTIKAGGYALDMQNFTQFAEAVKALREHAPNAPILGVCEDMDNLLRRKSVRMTSDGPMLSSADENLEVSWTHLLDGVGSELDGVLIIASTNSIERISDRLLRPGCFDIKVDLQPPTKAERVAFITELWEVPADHPAVVELVEATAGKVIAEVKSIAVRRFIDGLPDYAPKKPDVYEEMAKAAMAKAGVA
jgi:hypothetical protein